MLSQHVKDQSHSTWLIRIDLLRIWNGWMTVSVFLMLSPSFFLFIKNATSRLPCASKFNRPFVCCTRLQRITPRPLLPSLSGIWILDKGPRSRQCSYAFVHYIDHASRLRFIKYLHTYMCFLYDAYPLSFPLKPFKEIQIKIYKKL